MGGKVKYGCCSSMLKVNKVRNRHLYVVKVENYCPTGELFK
jgi:hypothetical protein